MSTQMKFNIFPILFLLQKGAQRTTVQKLYFNKFQDSGGQESQSGDDAVCGFKKADISCDTKQPINDSPFYLNKVCRVLFLVW